MADMVKQIDERMQRLREYRRKLERIRRAAVREFIIEMLREEAHAEAKEHKWSRGDFLAYLEVKLDLNGGRPSYDHTKSRDK